MKNYLSIILLVLLSSSVQSDDFAETLKLAEQGDARAQFNLGVMYSNGEGVPENDIKAYVWWSMAKVNGNKGAKNNIEIFKKKMTKEQIAKAQELGSKCYESDYKDCD